MKRFLLALVFVLACSLLLVCISGCIPGKPQIRVISSPDSDIIPTTIGIHPFLSMPMPTSMSRPRPGIRPLYQSTLNMDDQNSSLGVTHSIRDKNIYITPPTGSQPVITPYSQIFTGFVSVEMAAYGFDLRELPVEIPEDNSLTGRGNNKFAISLALLEEMRESYGLDAILIGNVYFARDPYDTRNRKISTVYVKLIDVETLKVICQFSMPYDSAGADMNEIAEILAWELAGLAGLVDRQQ